MMKSFKDYLMESKKVYTFRVKLACDLTEETESSLRSLLEKYHVVTFNKVAKTPIQALPLDFPRLSNREVNIWEVGVDYPVAPHELVNYIGNGLRISEQFIVVKTLGDPTEEYQETEETRETALLSDSNYTEHKNANPDEYFGDKYNLNFLKELSATLKDQMKKRGEVRPSGSDGKTLNDIPQGNISPIGSKKGR